MPGPNYRSQYGKAEGHARWTFWRVFKWIIPVALLVLAVSVVGNAVGWFGEAQKVARKEFGPRAMLVKYEWFKNASASLEKRHADIAIFKNKIDGLAGQYEGVAANDWDRWDRQQMNTWRAELAGVTSAYNLLAAEYNSQSSKFNWKAFKASQPDGGTGLVQETFAPYQTE